MGTTRHLAHTSRGGAVVCHAPTGHPGAARGERRESTRGCVVPFSGSWRGRVRESRGDGMEAEGETNALGAVGESDGRGERLPYEGVVLHLLAIDLAVAV